MKSRRSTLQTIRDRQFDVCVIGGGATGSGTALDSQLRGKSTLLLEGEDFTSHTSSKSTKLVHGGVRYLQQAVADFDYGQFKMVRKALHERIHMLHAAPFLANSLELLVPCYSLYEMVYYGIGMKVYDAISGKTRIFPTRILSKAQALQRLPGLRGDRLVGAVSYADGQFDDARYGITLVQTFAEQGGEVLNYAKVVGFGRTPEGKLSSAEVVDQVSGERLTVQARIFVNCTGPHADEIRLMANPEISRRLRLSKGVHILLPVGPMGSDAALLIPKTEDGRVIFAIPWLGSLLVGTTDDEIDSETAMVANEREIAYLLKYTNRYLNTAFTHADVQAAFAGARPLVASKDAVNTKKLIRDHEVEVDERSNLVSILGGKWTTHRAMAEDGVNHALHLLGDSQARCKTIDFPLFGAKGFHPGYWRQLAEQHSLSTETAQHLAQKFGTAAPRVLEVAASQPELREPLYPGGAALACEVVYCVREEMARTIEDILARRVGIQFHRWKDAIAAAPVVGRLLGRELGWDESQTAEAVKAYVASIQRLSESAGQSTRV
ncbi:MAG: glycerol-3-phosphate dehydrogenase/oxidase [Terracidiphilus sp.]